MWRSIIRPVTEEIIRNELEPALNALPEWRKVKALSYRFDSDKYTCAKAYLLLKELLASNYGIVGDVEFGYGPNGKPFLKSYPSVHFNFSHCPKAVFCAVGDSPIGVDVEEIQYDDNLSRQVFSEEECLLIKKAERADVAFTSLWTRKESYLKFLGSGLTDDLRSALERPDPSVRLQTEVDLAGSFVWSVATQL